MSKSVPQNARPLETLADLPDRFDARGDAVAIVEFRADGQREIRYADLAERCRSLAAGLVARGLGEGRSAALFAPNSIDNVVCALAIALTGAVRVPVETDADAARLRALLRDSGAEWLFAGGGMLDVARQALRDSGSDITLVLLGDADEDEMAAEPPALRLEKLHGGKPVEAAIRPETIAARFYTSGTTGPPKAVPITHGNIAATLAPLLRQELVGRGDRILLPLPLHHAFPFVIGLLTPLACGARLVFPEGVSGPPLRRALREGEVTTLVAVPRLHEALLAALEQRMKAGGPVATAGVRTLLFLSRTVRRWTGMRLGKLLLAPLHRAFAPRLRLLVSGGARLEPRVETGLEALGWEVLSGYGLVETTSVATMNLPESRRTGSAGRPSEAVEMRIAPVPEQARGGTREHGEVQFRGPGLFAGYADNPEANSGAFTADGWFRTGDLGWLDRDGYLFIAGRLKEMIVLPDGKNIAPEDVEAVYARIEAVRELALLERDGRLVALVVPDLDAARSGLEPRLRERIAVAFDETGQELPRYMRPSDIVLTRESLPKNPLGKLQRHRLDDVLERAERGEPPPPRDLSPEDAARMATPRAAALLAVLKARTPDKTELHPDLSLQLDLGIDSLAWIDLGLEIERRAGITLPEDRMAEAVTLRDLIDLVESAGRSDGGVRAATSSPSLADESERWLSEPGTAARIAGIGLYGLALGLTAAMFRPRVEGRNRVPRKGPLIIAANHLSDADPVVLGSVLPYATLRHTWWGAIRQRVFRSRLGRLLARPTRMFPVDPHAPGASLEMAARVLERGNILVWFPEEWRSANGELQAFRPGIGALVERGRVPVLPCAIQGTFQAMPRTATLPRPHKVALRFGRPIPAEALIPAEPSPGAGEEAREERHRAIAGRIREEVAALLSEMPGLRPGA